MRFTFITFIISLVFFGFLNYLLGSLEVIDSDSLVEIEEEYGIRTQTEFSQFFVQVKQTGLILEIVNSGNLAAISIVLFLFLSTTFITIHSFIDKLFFKTFYQQPNFILAIRRGILFGILIISILALRIFGVFDIFTAIFVIIAISLIEFGFIKIKPNNLDLNLKSTELDISTKIEG